jgi:hypothetical protein
MMLGLPLALAAMGGSVLAGAAESKMQRKGKARQQPLMSPGQIEDSNWARQQGRNQITNPYQGFEPIQAYQENRFQNRTVPTMAERFTSMGSGSALSSPAFQADLKNSSEDLRLSLAALQSEYGLKNQELGRSLMQYGNGQQFENIYEPARPSFGSSLMGGVSNMLGTAGTLGMNQFFNRDKTVSVPNVGGTVGRRTNYNMTPEGNQMNYDYAGEPIMNNRGRGYQNEMSLWQQALNPQSNYDTNAQFGDPSRSDLQNKIRALVAQGGTEGGPQVRQNIQGLLSNYASQTPQQPSYKQHVNPKITQAESRFMEQMYPGWGVGMRNFER